MPPALFSMEVLKAGKSEVMRAYCAGRAISALAAQIPTVSSNKGMMAGGFMRAAWRQDPYSPVFPHKMLHKRQVPLLNRAACEQRYVPCTSAHGTQAVGRELLKYATCLFLVHRGGSPSMHPRMGYPAALCMTRSGQYPITAPTMQHCHQISGELDIICMCAAMRWARTLCCGLLA